MGIPKKPKNKRRRSGLAKLLNTTFLAAGGWIAYSNLLIKHNLDLPAALAAERKVFHSPTAERLSYYVDASTSGRPLVLLHSINAAASAYEMRPLFEHYRSQRPVYALDLPGYGFSDRSDRVYTPRFFQTVIQEFLASEVGEPADVVALSLAGEFAAIAAQSNPGLFHSLVLLSPTGLSEEKEKRASQKARRSGSSNTLYPVFSFPLWSQAFYDLIATRRSIKFFLQQSFLGPVPDTMVEYAYRTSHQPGARNVPLHFISGKLFTPDILTQVYQQVHVPGLVIYDHDAFTGFERLQYLLENSMQWKAVRIIPTNGLPHWEQLHKTSAALDSFWADVKGN